MDRTAKIKGRGKDKNVIIFSDGVGWHTSELETCLHLFGVKTKILNLSSLNIFIDCTKQNFVKRNFSMNPICCFVRGIEGGSLEQITRRLAILHHLKFLGVPVINSGKGIENSVDKCMTSFILRMHDIPTPDCWALEDKSSSLGLINRLIDKGRKLVIKPIFGSQGTNVTLIEKKIKNQKDLEEKLNFTNGVYYIQEFIGPQGDSSRDYRVFVVGSNVIAAMERKGQGWIHNVARGGVCKKLLPNDSMKTLAIESTRAVGLEVAGVDIIEDKKCRSGYQVLEVNGVPAWKGLQNISGVNISDTIVKFILSKMNRV